MIRKVSFEGAGRDFTYLIRKFQSKLTLNYFIFER